MLVSRVSTDDRPSANRNGAGKPGGRACPSGDSSDEQPTKHTILDTLNNIFLLEFYILTSLCFYLTVFFWIFQSSFFAHFEEEIRSFYSITYQIFQFFLSGQYFFMSL